MKHPETSASITYQIINGAKLRLTRYICAKPKAADGQLQKISAVSSFASSWCTRVCACLRESEFEWRKKRIKISVAASNHRGFTLQNESAANRSTTGEPIGKWNSFEIRCEPTASIFIYSFIYPFAFFHQFSQVPVYGFCCPEVISASYNGRLICLPLPFFCTVNWLWSSNFPIFVPHVNFRRTTVTSHSRLTYLWSVWNGSVELASFFERLMGLAIRRAWVQHLKTPLCCNCGRVDTKQHRFP